MVSHPAVRRGRNWRFAWVVITAVLLSACTRGAESSAPAASLGDAPTAAATPVTEATPTEADPYAIPEDPADIDEAYVERVLEALTASLTDATRMIVRDGGITGRVEQALASTHRRKEALPGAIRAFRAAVKDSPPREIFSRTPGRIDIEVERLITASDTCVFVLAQQDTSRLARYELDPFPGYYHLGRKRPGEDPSGRNPTPWMIVADAPPLAGDEEYKNPCG